MAIGVKGADRFDFIVEQVEPVGQGGAHGKQVNYAAPHRELAGRQHLIDVAVAGVGQAAAEGIEVELIALFEQEGMSGQEGTRRQPLQRRGGRCDHDIQAFFRGQPKGRQAFRDQVRVGRNGVVRQGFPVGKQADRQLRREPGDLLAQTSGVMGGLGQDQQPRLAGQTGQRQGIGRTGQ